MFSFIGEATLSIHDCKYMIFSCGSSYSLPASNLIIFNSLAVLICNIGAFFSSSGNFSISSPVSSTSRYGSSSALDIKGKTEKLVYPTKKTTLLYLRFSKKFNSHAYHAYVCRLTRFSIR